MPTAIRNSLASVWRPAIAFARLFGAFAGRRVWGASALVAAGALLDGVGLLLLIPIVDAVVLRTGGASRLGAVFDALGIEGQGWRLAVLLAAFVLLAVLRSVVHTSRDMALARLQTGFVEVQRNAVIRTLAAAPWSQIVGLRHARITNFITSEISRVAAGAQFMIQGAVAAVMLAVQAALALYLAPVLALGAMTLVFVGGGAVLLAQGKIREIGAKLVLGNTLLMSSATGFLSGLKAAAAQNAQAEFVAEFEATQATLREHTLAFQQRQASSRQVFVIGSSIAAALIVLVGFVTAIAPAVLITLVIVFARMSGPAMQLQQAAQNFFFMLPSFEALQAFDRDMALDRAETPLPVAPPAGPIEAEGVVLLHPGGGGIGNATLTIAEGSFVAIVGPSGAGKTTLIDLLAGLAEPQAGRITVGGMELDAAARAGWRERVAYVPQEGFLFHDTVRRNLAWGNGPLDDAALWDALVLVGADAVVRRMAEGLDTIVGERGALLSGGERQRLALARAMLRRARLLVLDEAMNALDLASETLLLQRIAALAARPTVLMISHRTEGLALCDRIIRVEHGIAAQ